MTTSNIKQFKNQKVISKRSPSMWVLISDDAPEAVFHAEFNV